MKYEIYKEFHKELWLGGETCQLGIFPESAKVSDKNFLWRVSKSDVKLENSTFSDFAGFERVLMVLEGEIIISHGDDVAVKLGRLAQDRFDGGDKTNSFGKVKDYNLIVKKGIPGAMDAVKVVNKKIIPIKPFEGYDLGSVTVYCARGFGVISIGEKKEALREDEQLIVNFRKDELDHIDILGAGEFIICEIFYSQEDVDKLTEEAKQRKLENEGAKDKTTGKGKSIEAKEDFWSDWKFALKISNLHYRGKGFIKQKSNGLLYSKPLKKAIRKIKNQYITFFIGSIGFAVFAFGSLNLFGTEGVIPATIIWFVIDFILVNPLIYYVRIPKPIANHVKHVSQIRPEEREMFDHIDGDNQIADKILKRYKISGRNVYIDDEDNGDDEE